MTFNDNLILLVHFALCICSLFIFKINYFNKFFFYYALLNIVFLLFHPIIISDSGAFIKNFGNIIRISSFLMIITILGKIKFLKIYVRCLFVLSLFNLILFVDHVYLFSFTKPISSLFSLLKTYDNIFYENYIFYGKMVNQYGTAVFSKNPGIFGEGGYYQYFLNLALIINLFYFKKPILNKENIIFVVTILSTFSTIAYLSLSLIFFTYILANTNVRNFFALIPFLIVFIVYFFQTQTIYSKLFDYETTEFRISTVRRMTDTYIDLMIIKLHPLSGIGMSGNYKKLYSKLSDDFGGGTSSSNGILQYTSGFGFVGILLAIYPYILYGFRNKRTFIVTACNILTGLTQEIIMMPMFLLSIMIIKKTANK